MTEENKTGKASTKAKNKYNAANYDRLYPVVPKGQKAVYEAAAKAAGMSLNDFVVTALDEKIERDKQKEQEG
ncbi:transcriptional regulator [Paenibacillus medicaginis]|uniref:Transcriptional regulator n=1 Tax=Paenibacillus medicaginis TaxID=1470560 RepID=A0ABV5C0H0_9BACL